MKKLLCAFLFLPSLVWADITVTPGAGKTVATTTDSSREFQNVVVTTSSVNNSANVPVPVGWQVGGGSFPVHEAGTANVNITAGSIANTGFNVNNAPSITAITNALPAGTNNLGTVTGSTFTLQGSNGSGITSTAGALDINIKSGSIANTGFNVNNNVTLNALPTGTNNIGTVTGSTMSLQLSGGVPADANSGNKSAGTLRVILATDQPALTNKLLVTPDSVALPANQSVNVSQINAVTPLMGNGVTGTGSQRVTVASDNTPFSVLVGTVSIVAATNNTTSLPMNLSQIGGTAQSGANVVDAANTALRVNVVAGAAAGGTSSNFKAVWPSAGTAAGYVTAAGNMQAAEVTTSSEVFVNMSSVGGSAASVNADGGIAVHLNNGGSGGTSSTFRAVYPAAGTAAGFVDIGGNMEPALVSASSGIFVTQNAPQSLQTSTYISGSSNTVIVSTMGVLDIGGISRPLGYSAPASSMPVNVLNTVTITGSISNTGFNVNNAPSITAITNALPAGTNNIGTIGGLNNVVISSFAATSTPQVNVVMVASTPVVTAGGQAGEIRVSAEISGSSNTFQGGLAHNGAAAATNRLGTTPAIVQTTPANGTALTGGRDAALSVGTDGNLWVSNQPAMRPASFYASVSSASYTTTTDLACLPGNATNTVIVRRIMVSCTETTAGQVTVSVLRRSAADSAGTSANMPVGKDDSTSGSAVSVPLVYSAAPTRGTLDSLVDIQTIGCMASATASPNDVLVENWNDKAKVLRGTAQEFCVSLATPQDLAGTTVTGGNFNVHFEWSEITSITP